MDTLSNPKTTLAAALPSADNTQPENIKTLLDKVQLIGNTQGTVATLSKQAPTPIQDVQKAADTLNQLATSHGLNVQFEVVNNGQKVILVVRDTLDNNIIREIPGNRAVNLSQNFDPKLGLLLSMSI
jgi:uncharacterized FlaG/YvyC family protein